MKMAKPSERDIDAAGDLLSLLIQLDRGDYPNLSESDDVPDWFDEDNFDHLRAFYDAVKSTLDKGPGYPGRVIGGMCYVIMWDKNEIVDPNSDTIDLHPKLVAALKQSEELAATQASTSAARDAVPEEAAMLCESDEQRLELGRCCAVAIRALKAASSAASQAKGGE